MRTNHRIICGLFLIALGLCGWRPAAAEVINPYGQAVMEDAPIGYWRLRESTPDSAGDETSHGRDLTYANFGTDDFSASGPLAIGGTAPTFSSDHDSAVHATDASYFGFASGQSFSYELWVRGLKDDNHKGVGLLTKGYQTNTEDLPWYLSRAYEGDSEFFTRDSDHTDFTADGSTTILDGDWHHMAAVYDAGEAENRVYVDGVLDAAVGGVQPDAYGTNDQPLYIGQHYGRNFTGQIAEVALYNSALSGERITAHFDAAQLVPEPSAGFFVALACLLALTSRGRRFCGKPRLSDRGN